MPQTVHCIKLGKEAEGLEAPPVPGELGARIHAEVSKEAWETWTRHQTMLINEHKLSVIDPEARAFLEKEMCEFLFGADAAQ